MEMSQDIKDLLEEVANDFETEGCDGCGTLSIKVMNKIHAALGWEPLDDDALDEE